MVEIIVDIFEDGNKVVRHIFYGKTKKEAEGNEQAHRATDSFYRAAMERGEWKGIVLTTEAWIKR